MDAYWLVNGNVLHQNSSSLDFAPTEAGTYIIEAKVETEDCPNGVWREFSITVAEDCL